MSNCFQAQICPFNQNLLWQILFQQNFLDLNEVTEEKNKIIIRFDLKNLIKWATLEHYLFISQLAYCTLLSYFPNA